VSRRFLAVQTSESEEAELRAAALSEALGRRIRKLRIDRALTLDEVAARSGCSVGSLSQIERGIGNPSFNTLVKISHALDISVGRLLEAAGTADPVVRRSERKRLPSGSTTVENGTSYELLTPNLDGALEVLYLEIPPGASTESTPFTHQGEEVGYILEGVHEVHLDGVVHVLREGDAITYRSTVPHWYRNPGPDTVRAIWIITPPSW
jgi:transcriptional regulator with XRE-family HTH domain